MKTHERRGGQGQGQRTEPVNAAIRERVRGWFRGRSLALAVVCATVAAAGLARGDDSVISLAGTWRLALDRADAGVDGRWFARPLEARVRLPGSLPRQGLGDPVTTNTPWIGEVVDKSWFTAPEYEKYRQPGRLRIPFWLQPKTHYVGAAWYQHDVEIPRAWDGRRVVLFLERPHWETRVWVDDRFVGTANALGTPHEHDLGPVGPGRHRLTIRVDNRMVVDIGPNSHSVSDHTQGNWNGIVGRIELQSSPPVWIDEIQAFPDRAAGAARIRLTFGNRTGKPADVTVECTARARGGVRRAVATRMLKLAIGPEPGTATTESSLGLGSAPRLWDEFAPNLYELVFELRTAEGRRHRRLIPFGLREFAAEGTRFTINGRPVFLRGTLECSIFPRTGHPPMDAESWRMVMRTARAHGLNHLRFHSHCPPDAAFQAADELGLYLHVEASSWANSTTGLGDGKPVDAWIYEETDRILRHYGNHPSFVLMPYGNEPGGRRQAEYLGRWVNHFKAKDPRRLWTSGAGWPQLPENQWHSTPDPRIQGWGQGLKSRINALPPETMTDYREYIAARTVPVVSHEIGQWCVYPNFDEIRKYTGYLQPRNFEIFRDTLAAHGLSHLARPFLFASGRLQTLCYKEDIESALRTPGMGGFQLLDLHDFPGQGTALVGVLDPFWEGKGYVAPSEFRRFCGPTVPLARLPKRVFTTAERLEAAVEIAHFGPASLVRPRIGWKLVGPRSESLAQGTFPVGEVPVGGGTALGRVTIDLARIPAPAQCRLVVGAPGRPGFENDWDVWVYPANVETAVPPGVRVTSELDAAAATELERGGRVVWMVPPARVRPDPKRGPVALGFSSIFWNTAWTGGQPPHTLGILCDPGHPALAGFPTEAFSNWQWWYLVSRAGAMILDHLPVGLEPTVRVIDDWVTARRLGLVFEARVGTGRLLVCSVDLAEASSPDPDPDPVRRQFRASLLRYVAGDRFQPATVMSLDQVRSVATNPASVR